MLNTLKTWAVPSPNLSSGDPWLFRWVDGLAVVLVKGILHFFFLEIGSFYNSLRVEQLGFTVFESH